jgi:hypothetical protein
VVGFVGVAVLNLFYVRAAWQIGAATLALFAGALACNGELARRAPPAAHLTAFYLDLAAGGVIGGTVAALAAPVLFDEFWEYPLFLILAFALFVTAREHGPASAGHARPRVVRWAALAVVPCLVFASYTWTMLWRVGQTVVTARNFFGVLRVYDPEPSARLRVRRFQHGRIVHGMQFLDPDRRMQPNSYYTSQAGIAQAIQRHPKRLAGTPMRIGVFGLGIGTIAAWGRSGDVIRFYEINPQVIAIAQTYFTFLSGTAATTEIVPGDARLALEREARLGSPQRFDLLVADAFSGDAVPVHLLTREACALYWQMLQDDGILAINITNRYLNLAPVVRGLAREFDKEVVQVVSAGTQEGALPSDWMLVTSNQPVLAALRGTPRPSASAAAPGRRPVPAILWTDSFSNLFQVLR